ncbi:MAG: helix-turn-helix domain-containing protein [Oscillospiraceae bacterium]
MDFGSRLKELRTQAGLTQLQLAQRMGITKSVVSFYELQERTPSPDVLVKLAGIFRVSTDYLLGLDKRETIDISGLSQEDIAIMRALAESLRRKNTE